MTAYRIEMRPAALRALGKLDPATRRRLQAPSRCSRRIRGRPARALRGRPGLRVRIGDYRVIYPVADDVLLVVVVTAGHRREIYDR